MSNKVIKRATGSYYTCSSVADYIAQWAIRSKNDTLLEPSFGDGTFLLSAIERYSHLGENRPQIMGVELQQEPYESFLLKGYESVNCYMTDYMDFVPPHQISVIIGNPPYVSLKNLSSVDRTKAIKRMESYSIAMPPNGSLWMPFMIHGTEMLAKGGRLGFVLPYEITYVRYAFRLWTYLSHNYGKISIYRIHDDFFPEVDVETVLFLAEEKGAHTDYVSYCTFKNLSDLLEGKASLDEKVSIYDIITMGKPFEKKLISKTTLKLLDDMRASGHIGKLLDECKFKIGYVCGNKNYFHPSKQTIAEYGLSPESLLPCIRNAKEINSHSKIGVDMAVGIDSSHLFYPLVLDKNSRNYISHGEKTGVQNGYKCKVRKPWYLTPNIEMPDVVLTVFGDVPRLINNSGSYVVSNSLLSGKMVSTASSKNLVCRWYNSITLLMIELNIHSLGGGTLVLIPGETDLMEILKKFPTEKENETFEQLDTCVKTQGVEKAYELGDEIVLQDLYGLSKSSITEIRKSVEYLRNWRKPDNRRE